MKTFKLFLLGTLLFVFGFSNAQVSINVNIGKPPVWGPPVTNEEYYYLPDIDVYYDIHHSQYIYLNNGAWIRVNSLPKRYRSYDLNTGYIVVLNDYHGSRPYENYKVHKTKYYKPDNNWQKFRGKNLNPSNGKRHGKGRGKH